MRHMWVWMVLGFVLGITTSSIAARHSARYSPEMIIKMSRSTYEQPFTLADPILDCLGDAVQRTWQIDTWSHELQEFIKDQFVLRGEMRRVKR